MTIRNKIEISVKEIYDYYRSKYGTVPPLTAISKALLTDPDITVVEKVKEDSSYIAFDNYMGNTETKLCPHCGAKYVFAFDYMNKGGSDEADYKCSECGQVFTYKPQSLTKDKIDKLQRVVEAVKKYRVGYKERVKIGVADEIDKALADLEGGE